MKAAVLFASRSVEVFTVTGQRIRGIGVNPMQILDNGQINVEKFWSKSHELVEHASLPREAVEDIKRLLDEIYAANNLYKKYESLLGDVQFKHRGLREDDNLEYQTSLKNVGWLLFICAKKSITELKETFEHIFLMCSVILYLVSSCPDNVVLSVKTLGEKPVSRDLVIEHVLTTMKIKDIAFLKRVQEMMKNALKKKIAVEFSIQDLFLAERIVVGQKKLDIFYQKIIDNIVDIDERLFLTHRIKNLSPKVLSPVKRYSSE